jgi:hypothetical protein
MIEFQQRRHKARLQVIALPLHAGQDKRPAAAVKRHRLLRPSPRTNWRVNACQLSRVL